VRGEIEGSFWDAVHEGIRKGAFRSVESPGDEIARGWTSIDDFDDCEFEGASYVRGSYVALAYRVDTVRVPPRILELAVKKETVKLKEQFDQKRISSGQRRELKERVKETLKRQVFPSIQVYDLVWDTAAAVAYLGTHGTRGRERVEEHFKKCFGLSLVPLIPYLRAEELLGSEAQRQRLEQLKPSSLAP
jgi:hypothetical protein